MFVVRLSVELGSLSEPLEVKLSRPHALFIRRCQIPLLFTSLPRAQAIKYFVLYTVQFLCYSSTSNEIPISSAAVCIVSGACFAHFSIIFALSPNNPFGRHQIHPPSVDEQPQCRSDSAPGLVRVTTSSSRAAGLVEDSGRITTQVGLIYSSVRLVAATCRLQPH